MGLLPGLEPIFNIRLLSGERAAAAMGWEVAVRLAKGFSSLACVDIISTSIKICPIKSLKSENTSFWFCLNWAESEFRKITSLSLSFQETLKILQTSCRACSSDTSDPDRGSLSVRLRFSLRSFSSTSMFSIPESTSTWDILFSQETLSMSML